MQRVLSFPTARALEDTSDFITKRLCFSFVLSVGFLGLLCGFLLGRFAFNQELALSRANLKAATHHHHHQLRSHVYDNFYTKNRTVMNLSTVHQLFSFEKFQLFTKDLVQLRNATADNGGDDDDDKGTAAAAADTTATDYLHSQLRQAGCDHMIPIKMSKIHISFPHPDFKNEARLIFHNQSAAEAIVIEQFNDTRSMMSSIGGMESSQRAVFSTNFVEGDLIYVNFGRDEDYIFLSENLKIDVQGRIVLIRATEDDAPEKVIEAAFDRYQVKGVLIYLDPQQKDLKRPLLNPYNFARLQLSQGVPFIKGNADENDETPTSTWMSSGVPVVEISAKDATRLFELMGEKGDTMMSPASWRGELQSSYPIGPGFADIEQKNSIKLGIEVNFVNTIITERRVFAAYKGLVRPDEFIIVTSDRNSLTNAAHLLNMAWTLNRLKEFYGWTPYRSVIFAPFIQMDLPFLHSVKPYVVSLIEINSQLDEKVFAAVNFSCSPLFMPFIRQLLNFTVPTTVMDVMDESTQSLIQTGIPFLRAYTNIGSEAVNKTEMYARLLFSCLFYLVDSSQLPFNLYPYAEFLNETLSIVSNRFKAIAKKHTLFLDSLEEATSALLGEIRSFSKKWSLDDDDNDDGEFSSSHQQHDWGDVIHFNTHLLHFVSAMSCQKEDYCPSSSNLNEILLPHYKSSTARHIMFSRSLMEPSSPSHFIGWGPLQDFFRQMTQAKAPEDLQPRIVTMLADLVTCLNRGRSALTDALDSILVL